MNGTFATSSQHFDQTFVIMFILDDTCKLFTLIKVFTHFFLSYADYFISTRCVDGLCTAS